jgi:hypothetical protein
MNNFNPGQDIAFSAFGDFTDSGSVLFGLLGFAGTGKSFLSAQMLQVIRQASFHGEILWLAPTWKAVRIASGFLQSADPDLEFEIGYDYFMHQTGRMILTTTQQALGIRPVIADNQTTDKTNFGKAGRSLLAKLRPRFIVIDEVSMLSQEHLIMLHRSAKEIGCQILIIGDPGQLPPVNSPEINWKSLSNTYWLEQIMRQSSDSAIPFVGAAIREAKAWRDVRGVGVVQARSAMDAFLDQVGHPSALEAERDVFIAYRNIVVDAVQEKACHKVYGHGRNDFAPGEAVIAQTALSQGKGGSVIANQDPLVIVEIGKKGAWGREITLQLPNGRKVETEYLSGEDRENRGHPYNVELDRKSDAARTLQAEWVKEGRSRNTGVDRSRRKAWEEFFIMKDQTVVDVAHPFATTSHKSQGSTYRNAFIAADDIERFDSRGLYVAVTRPSDQMIY